MINTDIVKRFDALVQQRKTLDQTYQMIEKFVVPFRGEFFSPQESEHEVEWRKREIFNSTAILAAQTLSASIQGSLMSPFTQWFKMRFGNEGLNTEDEAKEWLEACENIMYQELNNSNFGTEVAEFCLDLVSFGNGTVFEEEDGDITHWGGLDFSTVPVRDCYFELDYKGFVVNFYRRLQYTPVQMVSKFGRDNLPTDIVEKYDNSTDVDSKSEVIFCVFKREIKADPLAKVLSAENRQYGYKYVIKKDAVSIGAEGGYYEMPAYHTPWRRTSNSKHGYSPAMVVLSDILTLNELVESSLESLAKVIDPATLTTQRGLLSDLDLGRGGLTVVRSIDDIKAYESRARFDVGELKIDRLENAINRAFHVDQLQLKESPAMTATEVQVRYELMQRLIGPTLGLLKSSFLDLLINRTFRILYRAGKLPEAPEIVKTSGSEFEVEYTGPLPRAQKAETINATDRWVQRLASLAEIFPEIMDIPDIDGIARGVASMEGVPAKFITSKDDVKDKREQRKEKQKVAEMAQAGQMAGKAMQSLGKGQKELQGGQ